MRGITAATSVLVALTALTACAPEETGPPPTAATSPAQPSEPPPAEPTPTATLVAPGTPEYHDGHEVEPPSSPTWDDVDRQAAVDAAVTALELFARPDQPYEQWWAELGPLMSAQAQVDYQYVDPVNVPARAVIGGGVLVDETSASIAGVEVPTDVGTYVVTLSRTDDRAPWLVERFAPPQGEG